MLLCKHANNILTTDLYCVFIFRNSQQANSKLLSVQLILHKPEISHNS